MKAIYQKPELNIVLVATELHLLAGSGGLLGSGNEPADLNLSGAATTDAVSGNLSRQSSVWGDEEEDF